MVSPVYFLLVLVAAVCARKPCHQERQEALDKIHSHPGIVGVHVPSCDADGSYAPLECIEAGCRCVDKAGHQLKEYAFHVSQSADAACKCAREEDFIVSSGLVGKWVRCDAIGNYNNVQCLGSGCYCTDRKEGTKLGEVVHITEIMKLNC